MEESGQQQDCGHHARNYIPTYNEQNGTKFYVRNMKRVNFEMIKSHENSKVLLHVLKFFLP